MRRHDTAEFTNRIFFSFFQGAAVDYTVADITGGVEIKPPDKRHSWPVFALRQWAAIKIDTDREPMHTSHKFPDTPIIRRNSPTNGDLYAAKKQVSELALTLIDSTWQRNAKREILEFNEACAICTIFKIILIKNLWRLPLIKIMSVISQKIIFLRIFRVRNNNIVKINRRCFNEM